MPSQRKTLRIHYLQHVPYEGPGCITSWASAKGHSLSATQFYRDTKQPGLDAFDWLIIMGGPMGVWDDKHFPWLSQEKKLIEQAIDQGKTVIGICLGAQLIAFVLGAYVFSNQEKEIGWFPVNKTPEASQTRLFCSFPNSFTAFHWHGDTFSLPPGAIHLAQSSAYPHQAFQYGKKVLGLQFHLEITRPALQDMVKYGKHELHKDDFVQTAEELFRNSQFITQNNHQMWKLLDQLQEQS